MYLGSYDDQQLGGFFKKLAKKLNPVAVTKKSIALTKKLNPVAVVKKSTAIHKAVLKKSVKVVKKVAKPVAHIAAAYFTGGASLALSAKMLQAQKDKKAQAEQAEADRAFFESQQTAPAASPVQWTQSTAPPAGMVRRAMSSSPPWPQANPGGGAVTSFAPSGTEFDRPFEPEPSQPAWLIPLALGAAAGGLLLLSRRK